MHTAGSVRNDRISSSTKENTTEGHEHPGSQWKTVAQTVDGSIAIWAGKDPHGSFRHLAYMDLTRIPQPPIVNGHQELFRHLELMTRPETAVRLLVRVWTVQMRRVG